MSDGHNSRGNRVYLAAMRDGDAAATVQVRVEGRRRFTVDDATAARAVSSRRSRESPLFWLRTYGVERLRVSVHRRAAQTHPASALDAVWFDSAPPSSAVPGPSGLRVAARFRRSDSSADDYTAAFLRILQRLVGDRWVAAPLASLDPGAHERHVDVTVPPQNASSTADGPMIELSTTLPFLGDPLAAEGLRMLLRWEAELAARELAAAGPDGGAPLLAALQPNATVWSQVLLGRLAGAAAASGGAVASRNEHRGLWMQWTVPDSSEKSEDGENPLQGQWDYGLYYSRPVPPSAMATVASGRDRKKGSKSAQVNMMIRDLIPMAVAPVVDNAYGGDDPCCSLSSVTVLAAASAAEEKQKHQETVIELGKVDAAPNVRSCRAALAESAISMPIVEHAPDQFWNVAMHIEYEGYSRRRLVARVENRHSNCKAAVSLKQVVPRVLQPVWQSLQVAVVPRLSQATEDGTCASDSSLEAFLPWTSLDHHSIEFLDNGSVQLILEHTIPVDSFLQLSLEFDPIFLPFEAFPGDPNRGFELPPLVAHLETVECPLTAHADLFSNSILFLPPLPDMSMPFNVLSLTCTFYVFVIGSIMNQLVRKASDYVRYTLHPDQKPKNKLQRLRERIHGVLHRGSRRTEEAQVLNDHTTDGNGDLKPAVLATPTAEMGREKHAQENKGIESQKRIEESPAKVLLDELLWMPSPKQSSDL